MSPADPVPVLCIFRVKEDAVERFKDLLAAHHPTLVEQGLAAGHTARSWLGRDRAGGPVFFHLFDWRDGDAAGEAHENPAVQDIWGPMGECCEERGGAPAMEFPHVEELSLEP